MTTFIDTILATSGQIESLTPQLINAGRIRMVYPENKAADEHFNNLKSQYSELLHQGRAWLDEVTDSKAFIARSLKAMQDHADHGEDAIRQGNAIKLVEHASALARLGNRVLQVGRQEAENSEDPRFISSLNYSADQLHSSAFFLNLSSFSFRLNTLALIPPIGDNVFFCLRYHEKIFTRYCLGLFF